MGLFLRTKPTVLTGCLFPEHPGAIFLSIHRLPGHIKSGIGVAKVTALMASTTQTMKLAEVMNRIV
jgi:hypothetical protein